MSLPVLNPDAKYGLAGKVVDSLHPFNEGDEATLLVEYLTLFGGMVGLKPHFYIGRTPHHARLYAAIVGQSGSSRKGSTFNLVRSVFDQVDADYLKNNIRKNVGSDAGILTAAAHSLEYGQNRGYKEARLIVVENEFVTLLAGGTLQRTSPMIRDAWDVSVLQSTVKRSRSVDHVHLSIIGMITLDELQHLLPNPRVQAQISNGLSNRFLTVLAQESKQLRLDQMSIPDTVIEDLGRETKDALELAWKQGPVPMERSVVDAQFQWRQDMKDRRAREISKSKIAPRMFDLLNRGETYLLRLAFIYALLDGDCIIRFRHYLAAEALWSYIEDSVRYIFGIPELSIHAQMLLQAVTDAGATGLTGAQMQGVLGRNSYYKDALEELLEAGKIVQTTLHKDGPGRPVILHRLPLFAELDAAASTNWDLQEEGDNTDTE